MQAAKDVLTQVKYFSEMEDRGIETQDSPLDEI